MKFIDKRSIKKIKEVLAKEDLKRERIILESRKALKYSKKAIYSIHRDDIKQAKYLIAKAKKILLSFKTETLGSLNQARQEYVEASAFLAFVENKTIPGPYSLKIDEENYLLGLCDLTGELARKSVMDTIKGRPDKDMQTIHSIVDNIFKIFLEFDLRNGELRKKSDAIKWNLKKIEEVMYDRATKK